MPTKVSTARTQPTWWWTATVAVCSYLRVYSKVRARSISRGFRSTIRSAIWNSAVGPTTDFRYAREIWFRFGPPAKNATRPATGAFSKTPAIDGFTVEVGRPIWRFRMSLPPPPKPRLLCQRYVSMRVRSVLFREKKKNSPPLTIFFYRHW